MPESSSEYAGYYLQVLGRGGGGLEAAGEGGPDLREARIKESVDAAKEMLRETSSADSDVRDAVLRDARNGLSKLAQEGPRANITKPERIGLEAVVAADGSRPVLFVQDGRINTANPQLGNWKVSADLFDAQIRTVARSVCRINSLDLGGFAGTGFAIAPGVVVTNRHVLQLIADEHFDPATEETTWTIQDDVSVDFAGEFNRPDVRSFAVKKMLFTGPDAITKIVDFNKLDLAVLGCEVPDGEGFPVPLSLEADVAKLKLKRPVYVMGFPGRPAPFDEEEQVLTDLFKDTFGFKRWAPGFVTRTPGEVGGDGKQWVHSHDASTLGGNSGSCVVDFSNDGARVVGLHFGGLKRVDNFAHAIAKLQQELKKVGGQFL